MMTLINTLEHISFVFYYNLMYTDWFEQPRFLSRVDMVERKDFFVSRNKIHSLYIWFALSRFDFESASILNDCSSSCYLPRAVALTFAPTWPSLSSAWSHPIPRGSTGIWTSGCKVLHRHCCGPPSQRPDGMKRTEGGTRSRRWDEPGDLK